METLAQPSGQLILTPHPITLDGQRVERWCAGPGQTLHTLLSRYAPAALDGNQTWIVSIGGVPVPREYWLHTTPKPGQMIEVRGGTGKAALAIVAFVALTYFTFGIGAYGGMAGLIGGAGGMAAATGVFMAGSMLINKVLAPKQPRPADQPNTVYSIGAGRNQVRQYQPLPLVFGRVQYAPDIIGAPYPWYQGNDQYLGMVLTPGINAGRVEALYNGDTLLSTYEGARVWHSGFPGMAEQVIPLYGNADAIAGAELNKNKAWVQRTTPKDTVRATVNLEYILGDNDRKGAKNNHETVEVQYRKKGTQNWHVFATRRFVNNNYDTLRTAFSKDLPKGQYDIRVRRLGRAIEHTQGRAQFAWTTLIAVQADEADYSGIPRIGVELKATGQLQQPEELRCIVHSRPIPVWKGQGAGWVTEETSNPGAHLLAYARGIRDANNRPLAGMFLHDNQIDIPAFQAFMLHCAAEGYTYDYVVKDARNHDTMCNALALAGLGQIAWSAGRLSIIWAADGQPLQGVVNMATIKRGSFQIDYTLANAADGIEYSYYDASDWTTKTLRVAVPGQIDALNPASVTGEGITNETHAARLARYHLAQSLYQYKDIQFTADLEHLSYRRMSVLALQHDLTQWGYGGRVQKARVSNGKVVLTLEESVPAPISGNAFVGLRIPGERVYRVFKIVKFTGHSNTLALSDPWPSDIPLPGNGTDNPAPDTLWIYDVKQTPGYRVRVVGIEPETDFSSARVRVVPESPEFWNYVLNGQYVPPVNTSLLTVRPVASNLKITESQITQGNTVYTELQASFDIEGPMAYCTIHAAMQDGNDWSELHQVAESRSNSARWRISSAGVYRIIVRPHTDDGVVGGIVETTYTTIAANIPPAPFDWFNVEALSGGIRRYTWGYSAATVQAPDFAGAEIRYRSGTHTAPSWNSMTALGGADGYLTNGAEFTVPPAGEWTFAARARNTSGNISSPIIIHKTLAENLGEHIADIDQNISDITQQQIDQQSALDAEVLARTQGDLQTALNAAADAQAKADAALANASEQTNAALAQALAAANAALTTATAQTDALAAEVAEIVNAPEWEADHSYITGWLVRYNNALYRATEESTGQPPDQHPNIWEHLGQYSSVAGIAAAALSSATTNASDLAAEAARINALVARMPGGNGKLATQASVSAEQTARATGDAANASAIEVVSATVEGKADASAVSAVTTRVEGLEAAGYGHNLLPNTSFNNGVSPWLKGQKNSTWTAIVVDRNGEMWHPPGIHNLGIGCPNSTLDNTDQYGQMHTGSIVVTSGQRYMASCYIANHRCKTRLSIHWYDADNAYISPAHGPVLSRKTGGQNLDNWHHAVASGIAPANAAYARLVVRFFGDGGENPLGWILRPMLEQARDTQTKPSPWNPGGLETSIGLLIETQRTDALIARMPAGTGKLAPEAALVSEQNARISGDAANAGAITVEASRIDGIMTRMPGGNGQLASQASIVSEQNARIAGDMVNATAIESVSASVDGKADASVVSAIHTRVSGLEAAGYGSNLLSNTTFNGGVQPWFRTQTGSTWTAPAVDLGGDNRQPPGMHSLGIKCTSGELDNTQRGRIYSPNIAVIPEQRYIASCHLSNHRCQSRLYLIWRDADNTAISSVSSPTLTRKTGGQNLDDWHHAIASGIAPANAVYAQIHAAFIGDGGTNSHGWILRPMLEQARDTQTKPSPWNPGGLETSTGLLIESQRTDALIARMPAGTGKLVPEAALVSEQNARISGDAANAGAITVEASRIDGIMTRMPGGNGQLATDASVIAEQNARISGDAVNAALIQGVSASVAGKADASVVQSMNVRVAGLETAGHGVNLLTNTTFNSGTQGWVRDHIPAMWSEPDVNYGGAPYHPPGLNSLGMGGPDAAWWPDQFGQLRSATVAAVSGQRYLASCYILNHQCNAQILLCFRHPDNTYSGIFYGPVLNQIPSSPSVGQNLNNWHRSAVAATAPANTAFVDIVVRFLGNGSTQPHGWIIRPMLEQAGEYQTKPSPWNPGGMETSAEYGLAVKSGNVIGGMRMHNNGQIVDTTFAADIFRVVSPGGASEGMEIQNGTLRVWKGNAQRIIGNGFGPNNDLMEYFGPNVGVNNASKSNATMWMDIHGNAWWGGETTSGPLKYTAHSDSTQTVGLELINGPFPTNGNIRTVTITFSRHSRYTKTSHGSGLSLGNGSNAATIQIYRKIGNANEVLWHTLTAGGSSSVMNEFDGPSFADASWSGSTTVTDTSSSTQTVRYRAVITALTQQAINGTVNQVKHSQSLKITSIEGA